jgi:hypothetical protein
MAVPGVLGEVRPRRLDEHEEHLGHDSGRAQDWLAARKRDGLLKRRTIDGQA